MELTTRLSSQFFFIRKPQMDQNDLIRRLTSLQPGESLVYHSGKLEPGIDFPKDNHDGRLLSVAAIALQLAQSGRVHLTQRRLGPPIKDGVVDWRNGYGPGFEYIATGAAPREKKK